MTPPHGANNVRVRPCEFYHQTIAARILNNITETPQRLIHSFFSRDSEWAVYRCEHTQRKLRHGVITPLAPAGDSLAVQSVSGETICRTGQQGSSLLQRLDQPHTSE